MKAKAVHRTLGKIHLELDPHEAKYIRTLLGRQMEQLITRNEKYKNSLEYRMPKGWYDDINKALEELG